MKRKVPGKSWIMLLVLLGTLASTAQASVRYVDPSAPGPTHDGLSWASAYLDLQDALADVPSGTHLWVAAGTYFPGTTSGTYFILRDHVLIYGAFPPGGGDGTFNARDVNNPEYETILSGDVGVVGDPTDNCSVIVYANNVTDAEVNGFSITG